MIRTFVYARQKPYTTIPIYVCMHAPTYYNHLLASLCRVCKKVIDAFGTGFKKINNGCLR